MECRSERHGNGRFYGDGKCMRTSKSRIGNFESGVKVAFLLRIFATHSLQILSINSAHFPSNYELDFINFYTEKGVEQNIKFTVTIPPHIPNRISRKCVETIALKHYSSDTHCHPLMNYYSPSLSTNTKPPLNQFPTQIVQKRTQSLRRVISIGSLL